MLIGDCRTVVWMPLAAALVIGRAREDPLCCPDWHSGLS
jgi:hypothetical protein